MQRLAWLAHHRADVVEARAPVRRAVCEGATLDDVLNNLFAHVSDGEEGRLGRRRLGDGAEVDSMSKDGPFVLNRARLVGVLRVGELAVGDERAADDAVRASLVGNAAAAGRREDGLAGCVCSASGCNDDGERTADEVAVLLVRRLVARADRVPSRAAGDRGVPEDVSVPVSRCPF